MRVTNTIRELRFVAAGDEYTRRDETGGGFYRTEAQEPGYYLRLADSTVYVTEAQLDKAKATSFAERHPVAHEEDGLATCSHGESGFCAICCTEAAFPDG